ncbi:Calreticulin family-domain-containing protein [Thamnocephalis sphaerospora]|uniref:Calreticulin family-domain-containing protein n=1 Tax=Thamnocephalis sphaerospora TaxID=78915 RepID=A0A4P9XSI7_9FUNG|nr:Calreticulin family-domain-containing protein [Thamnocephalis sphaerospora]|eukprot:RKP08952.1 Calreticulin family-domain-containing protein [Thamnocephalis sphaerospora]
MLLSSFRWAAAALALLTAADAISGAVYLEEPFASQEALARWHSSAVRDDYGALRLSAGRFHADAENLGLQTTEDYRFYAVSTPLSGGVFDNQDRILVLQYSVKHEQNIDCGGGYLKASLLPEAFDADTFDGDSAYNIMFGPDICGQDRKVQLIFRYRNKSYPLLRTVVPPADQLTHLYTLIVRPDQTYEILIDQRKEAAGSLLKDFAFPKATIEDASTTKPDSWVDEATIVDETDVKPAGYDDIPQFIPVGPIKPPRNWDAKKDGEWTPELTENPEYQGEWQPRRIPNPEYRGPWKRPHIPNPDYVPDDSIYAYRTAYVGLDIWQVKSGTIFDDILITDDEAYAHAYADKTYVKRSPLERAAKRKLDEEEEEELRRLDEMDGDDEDDSQGAGPTKEANRPTEDDTDGKAGHRDDSNHNGLLRDEL